MANQEIGNELNPRPTGLGFTTRLEQNQDELEDHIILSELPIKYSEKLHEQVFLDYASDGSPVRVRLYGTDLDLEETDELQEVNQSEPKLTFSSYIATTEKGEHASLRGAILAGGLTGAFVGIAAGPIGVAVGFTGGAIVGGITERVLHAEGGHQAK